MISDRMCSIILEHSRLCVKSLFLVLLKFATVCIILYSWIFVQVDINITEYNNVAILFYCVQSNLY